MSRTNLVALDPFTNCMSSLMSTNFRERSRSQLKPWHTHPFLGFFKPRLVLTYLTVNLASTLRCVNLDDDLLPFEALHRRSLTPLRWSLSRCSLTPSKLSTPTLCMSTQVCLPKYVYPEYKKRGNFGNSSLKQCWSDLPANERQFEDILNFFKTNKI